MTKIIVRVEGHYETKEVPFARSYDWHQAYVILECDCGERLAFTDDTSTITTCRRCGTDHTDVVHRIQEREGQLPDKVAHPWHHDTKEQAKQHQRDEAAYPKDSPWRYNDITLRRVIQENDK
ncbi:MAG: hypothetical protein M3246_03360 [Actinomycetota bacterium]|nr:hypothetical protein [Actinomycetota bacterium]